MRRFAINCLVVLSTIMLVAIPSYGLINAYCINLNVYRNWSLDPSKEREFDHAELIIATQRWKLFLFSMQSRDQKRSDSPPINTKQEWGFLGMSIVQANVTTSTCFLSPYETQGERLDVVVPLWMPTVCCAILPTWAVAKWHRRRRIRSRELHGLCQECGYDLRASSGRCPECGTAFESRIRMVEAPEGDRI